MSVDDNEKKWVLFDAQRFRRQKVIFWFMGWGRGHPIVTNNPSAVFYFKTKEDAERCNYCMPVGYRTVFEIRRVDDSPHGKIDITKSEVTT